MYDIYRCSWSFCAGLAKIASGLTVTSYVDTDVRGDTDYYYNATARNDLGSKDSNQVSVSTAAQNCGGTSDNHTICDNGSCITVPGTGANECSNPQQCQAAQSPSPQTHTICQSGACVTVQGTGSNQCSSATELTDCPQPAPTCTSFSADPSRLVIPPAAQSTLSWSCSNVRNCSIDQGVGSVSAQGSAQVSPSQTTTYTLTCSGSGDQAGVQATTNVLIRVFEFVGGNLREINPQ